MKNLISRAVLPAVVLGLLAMPSTQAEERDEIAPLIARLASNDFASRQAAEDDLVSIGDEAVPKLQVAEKAAGNLSTGDPETLERIKSALARIARNRQLLGTLIAGAKFPTPASAFESLARSAGLKLKYVNAQAEQKACAAKPITLTGKRKPLLQAMDEAIAASELDCRLINGDQLLVMNFPAPTVHVPSVYAGAMALRVLHAERSNVTAYEAGRKEDTISLILRLTVEKSAKLESENASVELTRFDDEAGHSLLTRGQTGFDMPQAVPPEFQGGITFPTPTPAPRKIAHLQGVLHTQALSKSVQTDFDLSALPANVDQAENTVTLSLVDRPDHRPQLEFHFIGPTAVHIVDGNRLSAIDTTLLFGHGALRVTDANGKPFTVGQPEFYNDNSGWPTYTFVLDAPAGSAAPPAKLTWTRAQKVRDVNLPFNFIDLPLP